MNCGLVKIQTKCYYLNQLAHHCIHPNRQNKFHINPLNTKLNPICHLLALLGAHHILHISTNQSLLSISHGSLQALGILSTKFHNMHRES